MQKTTIVGCVLAAAMMVAALPVVAQQDEGPILRPKTPPAKPAAATLLVLCDLACNWKLDGEAKGRIEAGGSAKANVVLGQHMVAATTEDGLDKIQQLTEVKAAEQSVVNLELQPVRDARIKTEQEAKDKAAQEAKEKSEQEARDKVQQEVRDKAAREATDKAAQETKEKAAQEAKEKAGPQPDQKVPRGSIGVQFRQGLSAVVNRVYGNQNGVLLQAVQPGGPAEKAGLKQGDIITTINGNPVLGDDDLVKQIASRRPGSTIILGYLRDGNQATTMVAIGDRDVVFAGMEKQIAEAEAARKANPDKTNSEAPGNASNTASPVQQAGHDNSQDFYNRFFGGDQAGEGRLGIVVVEISRSVATKLRSPGVEIQSVLSGSFAEQVGVTPGLVILRINRQPTGTRSQFNAVAGKLKSGDDVVFEMMDPLRPNDGASFFGGTLK
jgi:S1-C subfamily serine protease